MAHTLDVPQQIRSGQRSLVMPPLLAAVVFCFGFVLLQVHTASTKTHASLSNRTSNVSNGQTADLSAATSAASATLSPLPVSVTDGTDPSQTPSTNAVGTAQPGAVKGLQDATGYSDSDIITVPAKSGTNGNGVSSSPINPLPANSSSVLPDAGKAVNSTVNGTIELLTNTVQ